MTAPAKVRLLTGGDLLIDDGTDLSAARPRALFVLLALNAGETLTRDRLCDYLWPYTDQSTARRRLRMALLNMKRGLSEDLAQELRTNAETLALDIDPWEVDALRFLTLAEEATPEAQRDAVALYHGDLLAQFPPISDEFDRVLDARREAYRVTLLSTLHDMMRDQTASGDRTGFEATCRRANKVDPTNDDTATLAMSAAAADGQAQRVQDIYDAYVAAVKDSFDVDPSDAMAAARDGFLAEAGQQSAARIHVARQDAPTTGLSEIRAKPRVALRRRFGRKWVLGLSAAIVVAAMLMAGGYLWSRALRPDASDGEVFLLRRGSSVTGDCAGQGDMDAFRQALLDALQGFEGSNTILGAVRRRLVGSGPGIYDVDLVVTCLAGAARATITVVNTENHTVTWVGRFDADPARARDLAPRIYAELARVIRP